MTTTDPTTTPPLDLDAIRRRIDTASPGPWIAHPDGLVWTEQAIPGDPVSGSVELADAEFIAHARTDVEMLLDELIEVRVELDYQRQMRANYDELHADQVEQLRAELAEAQATIATLRQVSADAADALGEGEPGTDLDHPDKPTNPDAAVACLLCAPLALITVGQLDQHNRDHHADALAEAAQS